MSHYMRRKNEDLRQLRKRINEFEIRMAELFARLQSNGNQSLLHLAEENDKASYTGSQEGLLRELHYCTKTYETIRQDFEKHFPGELVILEADALAHASAALPKAYRDSISSLPSANNLDQRIAAARKSSDAANENLLNVTGVGAIISAVAGGGSLAFLPLGLIGTAALITTASISGGLLVAIPLMLGVTYLLGRTINERLAKKPQKEHDKAVAEMSTSWEKSDFDSAKIGFFHCKQLVSQPDMQTLEPRAKAFMQPA